MFFNENLPESYSDFREKLAMEIIRIEFGGNLPDNFHEVKEVVLKTLEDSGL
jgi:cytochrome c-type biogenesis protein CcmE